METIKNKLKSFFTSHWKYMAVSTACKLNIFDNLQKPKTAGELATSLMLNKEKTLLLLNALHTSGFLDKSDNLFSTNPLSELLTEDNPDSLKYACTNWSEEHLTTWQHLSVSIETGESAFESIYDLPFFDYLNQHPEKLQNYHKAMNEYARDDYKTLPNLIDFSKHKSIMDVGGGYGALLKNIQAKNPNVECVLFDLEQVVEGVSDTKFKTVAGDFFKGISYQTEAIILARVLHDWSDAKANHILRNCFNALPHKGTLYVIENCADKIDIDLSLLSLNMTAMCESHERLSKEYICLVEDNGFCFEKGIRLNELQTILSFIKK